MHPLLTLAAAAALSVVALTAQAEPAPIKVDPTELDFQPLGVRAGAKSAGSQIPPPRRSERVPIRIEIRERIDGEGRSHIECDGGAGSHAPATVNVPEASR